MICVFYLLFFPTRRPTNTERRPPRASWVWRGGKAWMWSRKFRPFLPTQPKIFRNLRKLSTGRTKLFLSMRSRTPLCSHLNCRLVSRDLDNSLYLESRLEKKKFTNFNVLFSTVKLTFNKCELIRYYTQNS